ncbi:MAG: hypothetical protein FWD83_10300 [Promicromonosporaceae bacterium]|nr:hypothetical protein [Promicromonosporaceae bacterium]
MPAHEQTLAELAADCTKAAQEAVKRRQVRDAKARDANQSGISLARIAAAVGTTRAGVQAMIRRADLTVAEASDRR